MKKELDNYSYHIIKALFNCVADEERGALSKVFYNSSKKEIVATDGHVLRIEKIDLGEQNLLFDKKDFKTKLPKNKETIVVEVDLEDIYPDYNVCIPAFDCNKFENSFPVSVNLDLLSKIDRSILGENRFILFISTYSPKSPIKIYHLSNIDNVYNFIGLIMPFDYTKNDFFNNLKNSKNSQ